MQNTNSFSKQCHYLEFVKTVTACVFCGSLQSDIAIVTYSIFSRFHESV